MGKVSDSKFMCPGQQCVISSFPLFSHTCLQTERHKRIALFSLCRNMLKSISCAPLHHHSWQVGRHMCHSDSNWAMGSLGEMRILELIQSYLWWLWTYNIDKKTLITNVLNPRLHTQRIAWSPAHRSASCRVGRFSECTPQTGQCHQLPQRTGARFSHSSWTSCHGLERHEGKDATIRYKNRLF